MGTDAEKQYWSEVFKGFEDRERDKLTKMVTKRQFLDALASELEENGVGDDDLIYPVVYSYDSRGNPKTVELGNRSVDVKSDKLGLLENEFFIVSL